MQGLGFCEIRLGWKTEQPNDTHWAALPGENLNLGDASLSATSIHYPTPISCFKSELKYRAFQTLARAHTYMYVNILVTFLRSQNCVHNLHTGLPQLLHLSIGIQQHLGRHLKVNNAHKAIWTKLRAKIRAEAYGKADFSLPFSSAGWQMSNLDLSTLHCAMLCSTTWLSLHSHQIWTALPQRTISAGQTQ